MLEYLIGGDFEAKGAVFIFFIVAENKHKKSHNKMEINNNEL